MIIPVKCFTCGNVLGNKYRFYIREVRKVKSSDENFRSWLEKYCQNNRLSGRYG